MSPNLQINFGSLQLKNPIIAASAGTTKDAEHALRAEDAGCSAVILKSIQEELVNRYNPFPRFAVIRNGISDYNSISFMSYEQAFEGGIDEYAVEIIKTKNRVNVPVIASLNCATHECWAEYAKVVEQAGADAVEIVPSCPVGAVLREGEEFGPIAMRALRSVKAAVSIPVGVKMTQQMANPIICALDLAEAKADWVTMFNRGPGLQIDIESMSPIMHKGICGHGGPWVVQSVMRWIAQSYPYMHIPISATGGVTRWEDVIRYMLAGANNVQVASLIYMKGYGVIKKILDAMEAYLQQHQIDQISSIIGHAAKQILPLNDVDRSSRYSASVDDQKCIGCGKCKEICIYDAIEFDNKKPIIDPDKCDGCGLCAQICNRAISMQTK